MPIDPDSLPYVDEHSTEVAATPASTWAALLVLAERLPRFRVAATEPERELTLVGAHRFARYALIFRLEPRAAGSTLLRAETRAEFPGLEGGIYRGLVIGTRLHVLATRRLLGAARARAERA